MIQYERLKLNLQGLQHIEHDFPLLERTTMRKLSLSKISTQLTQNYLPSLDDTILLNLKFKVSIPSVMTTEAHGEEVTIEETITIDSAMFRFQAPLAVQEASFFEGEKQVQNKPRSRTSQSASPKKNFMQRSQRKKLTFKTSNFTLLEQTPKSREFRKIYSEVMSNCISDDECQMNNPFTTRTFIEIDEESDPVEIEKIKQKQKIKFLIGFFVSTFILGLLKTLW